MTISSTTRKALWAKSGNRCSLCRLELVQTETTGENVILGEECHIISSKPGGSRGSQPLRTNSLDDSGNLILLCANDHKRIDSMAEIYSVERGNQIKAMHEDWVKTTLSIDPGSFTNLKNKVLSLKKMSTGNEIIKVISGAHAFIFNNDDLTAEQSTNIMPLWDLLKDYVDILTEMTFSDKSDLGFYLNSQLEIVKNLSFSMFGIRRDVKLKGDINIIPRTWDIATLLIVSQNHPGIIGDFLMTETPKEFRFI